MNNSNTLASIIDHTILKPDANWEQIKKLAEEALTYGFFSVCVNPSWVKPVAQLLREKNNAPVICTVVGFPLGANTTEVKIYETKLAIQDGANEIDMVMNIGALKSGNLILVEEDIRRVVLTAGERIVKVILETCLLSAEEIVLACQLAERAGAKFVKTSTGFGSAGATLEHVKLMKKSVSSNVKVKASGGIKTKQVAEEMIAAGADRLGTSSGIAIAGN